MKRIQSMVLLLIIALINNAYSANLKTDNQIKSTASMNVQIMTKAEQTIFSEMWNKLFTIPRGNACAKTRLLSSVRRELIESGKYPGMNIRAQKNKFWWVKQWGYESSAYFFDFLDPLLRDGVVKEFQSVFQDLKEFPYLNSEIIDPFDFKKLISTSGGSLSTKQQKLVKKFTENYDSASYAVSANLPQVEAAIKKWKWPTNPGDPTYFRRFIQKYDMNYDGRLNPREFILASLYNNKQTVGSALCEHCYFETGKTLDAIFLYLDCNNDGLLSAEEIWLNLPKVNRKTNKWNIFSFGNDQSIRTASVNDFILKNGNTKDGFITRSEFRVGLLLGFWDRQTDVTKILTDDSRTLKNLRWEEGDMIDIALYNYNKKKMQLGLIQ